MIQYITNPAILGPLLVATVGAQQASQIQRNLALGNITLDNVYDIIENFAAPNALNFLKDLDKSALINILTKPKNALIKQYEKMFDMENVKLTFTDDALEAIADRALMRETGARGLRSILENILVDTMFELPKLDNVEEVVINKEVISDNKAPLVVYSKSDKKIKSSLR